MVTTKSSIGEVSSTTQPIRRFVVDDPFVDNVDNRRDNHVDNRTVERPVEDFQQEMEQLKEKTECNSSVLEEMQERRKKVSSISKEGKKKLELLLGLKKDVKYTMIDNVKIGLQNLSSGDTKKMYERIYKHEDVLPVEMMFIIRNLALAFTLYSVDGELMSDVLGDFDNIDMRLDLVENMNEIAIKELYEFYEKEIAVAIPATMKEHEEVAAQIKK